MRAYMRACVRAIIIPLSACAFALGGEGSGGGGGVAEVMDWPAAVARLSAWLASGRVAPELFVGDRVLSAVLAKVQVRCHAGQSAGAGAMLAKVQVQCGQSAGAVLA
jgi:hypothetical protein